MPSLCPRIRLRITDSPVPDEQRQAGEGNLDQVHRDLAELEELDCTYVVLDTYADDLDAIGDNETSWQMLSLMAEKVWIWANRQSANENIYNTSSGNRLTYLR